MTINNKWNVNVNAEDDYNSHYNLPAYKMSRPDIYGYTNSNITSKKHHKIVLVSEKQLFEGLVGGITFLMTSILLFKSGLTTKAFKRVDYHWFEVKVIFGIIIGWIFVWIARKISNVMYDLYKNAYGRPDPYEIAIHRPNFFNQ